MLERKGAVRAGSPGGFDPTEKPHAGQTLRKGKPFRSITKPWPPDRLATVRHGKLLRSGPCRAVCVWTGLAIRDSDEIVPAMGLGSGGLPHLWNLMQSDPAR